MFILEYDQRQGQRYQDPMVELGRSQFMILVEELRKGVEKNSFSNPSMYHDLADHLCEASREWLFRLHRVTPADLQDVVSSLGDAVGLMGQIHLDDKSQQSDVESYTQHIKNRIELVKNYLLGRNLSLNTGER